MLVGALGGKKAFNRRSVSVIVTGQMIMCCTFFICDCMCAFVLNVSGEKASLDNQWVESSQKKTRQMF